ncbi:MAG: IPExxxVDY family protein [Bacteroidia bacterium]
MKKLTLTNYISFDFALYGICSQEDDFKLCWCLNKALNIDFARIDDIVLLHPKHKNPITFSCFSFHEPETELDYYLMSNRSDSNWLLPEQKQTDFLLKVGGENELYDDENTLRKIKSLPQVMTAFSLNPQSIKSIENILI